MLTCRPCSTSRHQSTCSALLSPSTSLMLVFPAPSRTAVLSPGTYSILDHTDSSVLASSGVNTQAPVFNIGLFLPNGLKLAEGHGSSLSMAEHRAATNALLSLFLVKDRENLPLPTSVHAERPLSSSSAVASSAEEKTFRPHVGIVGLREPVEGLGKAMRTRN